MNEKSIWSIPYIDQPMQFWGKLKENFGDYIDEVYLPLPLDKFSSGRPEQPDRFVTEFLGKTPFKISFLINPIFFEKPVDEISESITGRLEEAFHRYNVKSVTVSNLMLAEYIKKHIPEIQLNASVVMDIFKPAQLCYINDVFDILVPSSRITRDIVSLQNLKDNFNGRIKLIVNEGCLPHCVFRIQHFFEMAGKTAYPKSLCTSVLDKDPWLRLTGSWILPQHINMYDGVYDKLKLSGRVTLQDPDYYTDVLSAYIYRKPRRPHKIGGGPVCAKLSMHIDDDFFNTILRCEKNCNTCTICREKYETYLNHLSSSAN
jgi:collagenase-like PrtC family protease